MKELDKKDSMSISAGYMDELKKKALDESMEQQKINIHKIASSFAIPKEFLKEVRRDDLFNEPFVHVGIDPARQRDTTATFRHSRGTEHERFIRGIKEICKEAEYMHERMTGERLYSEIIHDSFPNEVAVRFDSRYFRDTYVCRVHDICGYPYPQNIHRTRDRILGRLNDELRRKSGRRPPGMRPDFPNYNCGRLVEKEKEPPKIKAAPEVKSIVSNAIGEFNPDKIKLLENDDD